MANHLSCTVSWLWLEMHFRPPQCDTGQYGIKSGFQNWNAESLSCGCVSFQSTQSMNCQKKAIWMLYGCTSIHTCMDINTCTVYMVFCVFLQVAAIFSESMRVPCREHPLVQVILALIILWYFGCSSLSFFSGFSPPLSMLSKGRLVGFLFLIDSNKWLLIGFML